MVSGVGKSAQYCDAQMPVLTPWIGPVGEMKVLLFTSDEHCVLHMHHGKSLDASIRLGDVHGVLDIRLPSGRGGVFEENEPRVFNDNCVLEASLEHSA